MATRFVEEIIARCERLRHFPLAGAPREFLAAGLRAIFHKPYVVFYSALPGEVAVVRVLHGARDVKPLIDQVAFGPFGKDGDENE